MDLSNLDIERLAREIQIVGEHAHANKGFVPFHVFLALSYATVTNPVEVLPIRRSSHYGAEVLFTRRPATDPFFAGQWHTPGGMLRPGQTQESILAETIAAEVTHGEWQLVATLRGVDVLRGTGHGECPRGQYVCQPHIVEVLSGDSPYKGGHLWCGWQEPPSNLVSYQAVHLLPLAQKWIRQHWLAD